MKKLLSILVVLVLVVVSIFAFLYSQRNAMAAKAIRAMLERELGVQVVMGAVELKPEGFVKIHRFAVLNPSGYKGEKLAEVSSVGFQIDLKKYLFEKKTEIKNLRAEVDGVYLERNEQGGVNLRDLPALSEEVLLAKVDQSARLQPKWVTHNAELTILKVELAEYVPSQEVQKSEVSLEKKPEVLGNITDPKALVYLTALRAVPALNRGSFGIRRELIQARLLETTGVSKQSSAEPVS